MRARATALLAPHSNAYVFIMPKPCLLLLLATLVAAPAAAARSQALAPGIGYEKQVAFTRHGPVVLHVLTAPKPGGLYSLEPVLSNGLIAGRERITQMQARLSPFATAAGINGDFATADGVPNGTFLQDGVYKAAPNAGRSSIALVSETMSR